MSRKLHTNFVSPKTEEMENVDPWKISTLSTLSNMVKYNAYKKMAAT